MIQVNELRVGNFILFSNYIEKPRIIQVNARFFSSIAGGRSIDEIKNDEVLNNYHSGIPLTPEILEKAGLYQLPHFTVNNGWHLDIGRDRVITVACVGTPNEMIFLCEEDKPKVKNIIVLRNFDYDGKTYLHHFQNIVHSITSKELEIKL